MNEINIALAYQCDAGADSASTGCSADAMNIVIGITGYIVVDDEGYFWDIKTSSRDVRSD
jgi:hypothetical protein